ncbi:MAG: hypothetical protein MUO50_02375, partial [Longimicrobiales bacterium]|nr:hypothetical protein [Longimicrobiales bacterium]
MRLGKAGFLLILICTISPSSCGRPDGERRWTTAIDTLPTGQIHVVNSPPVDDPGPTWILLEDLRIGSVDEPGPSSFAVLKGLVVTDTGRIVVLDAQSQELRVFGPSGAHLATFGGKGGGPGELEAAWGLMLSPDEKLWVPDQRNARMSIF